MEEKPPIYSPFRAAQRKFVHKRAFTYGFAGVFVTAGVRGSGMGEMDRLMEVVGGVSLC